MSLLRLVVQTVLLASSTLAAFAQSPASPPAGAHSFPDKPIRIVVPYPPGGGGDTQTRMVGTLLSAALGQPVIVENRPGANGAIGTRFVAGAAPDGYTLLFTTATQLLVTPLLNKDAGFTVSDFAPVAGLSNQPMIIVVPPSSPIRTVADLIEAGKAKDAKVAFGSAGIGSLSHITGERLNAATGARFLHIPYKGTGQLMTAALSGELTYTFVVASAAIGHLKAGTLRPIAVVDATRSLAVPDVPTLREAGIDGFTQTAWFGLVAPAKTPKAVVDLLHEKIAKVLSQPEVKTRLLQESAAPWPVGPAEFAAVLRSEAPIYAEALKSVSK